MSLREEDDRKAGGEPTARRSAVAEGQHPSAARAPGTSATELDAGTGIFVTRDIRGMQPLEGAVVRAGSIGTGPRLGPGRGRTDWRARAMALAGARPLLPATILSAQTCRSRNSAPRGDGWLHEIKWDGYRLLAELRDGSARLRTRNGLDWTRRFPGLARALEALGPRDAWLDGELVALDAQGRSDFGALQRALRSGRTEDLRYLAFDLPALAGVDLAGAPLIERKRLLEQLLAAQTSATIAFSRHLVGHGERVLAASRRQGVQGIVSKRVDAPYAASRRGDWVAIRNDQAEEFVVIGYTRTRRRDAGLGSLLLARREGAGFRYCGRVRSGFDEADSRELLSRLSALLVSKPVAPDAIALAGACWVTPRVVVELEVRSWDGGGLLRQASFKRLREDKNAQDLEPEDAMPIKITHPERIVYASAGISKGEVAAYYRAVAPWLLGELAGRPLSLLRCPDGADAGCFFQKHHSQALGESVKSIRLAQKDGEEDYLYIDDEEGLLALVQMNTLEFHPWGSRVDDPERPDRMVFDLDPDEGIGWKQVVAAARDVRARLREHGLESYVRLTGGKGLHVVAPFERGPGWDELKAFCESVADAMVARHPDRYVATMSKAKRVDRIFIDWLRNSRGATSVTSWSLRARAGAPVAVPLRWEELGRIQGPDAFDLERAAARAARLRADPWAGIDEISQSLPGHARATPVRSGRAPRADARAGR